jgi:Gas vesicle protein
VTSDASGQVEGGAVERRSSPQPQIALVDLLDRLLGAGVVLAGDVVISLAGVDLVQVRLHALITSVRAEMRAGVLTGTEEAR